VPLVAAEVVTAVVDPRMVAVVVDTVVAEEDMGLLHEEEDTAADTEGHAAAPATALTRVPLAKSLINLSRTLVTWGAAVLEERFSVFWKRVYGHHRLGYILISTCIISPQNRSA